jgi:hypothetical protein
LGSFLLRFVAEAAMAVISINPTTSKEMTVGILTKSDRIIFSPDRKAKQLTRQEDM